MTQQSGESYDLSLLSRGDGTESHDEGERMTTDATKTTRCVAGHELDALVAEKVMGWFCATPSCPHWFPPGLRPDSNIAHYTIPHYSTSIAAAWEVVEKFRAHPYRCLLVCDHPDGYECQITSRVAMDRMWYGHADTAPLAICLAALKAVGH